MILCIFLKMWLLKNIGLSLAIVWTLSSTCYGQVSQKTKKQLATTLSESCDSVDFFDNDLVKELRQEPKAMRILKKEWLSPEDFVGKDFVLIKLCKDGLHRLSFYKKGTLKLTSLCSPGKKWHESITGVFRVSWKDKDHRSNTYDKNGKKPKTKEDWAPMPYAILLIWPFYIHGGKTTWEPLSHWCLRLDEQMAKYFFYLVEPWTTIVSAIR